MIRYSMVLSYEGERKSAGRKVSFFTHATMMWCYFLTSAFRSAANHTLKHNIAPFPRCFRKIFWLCETKWVVSSHTTRGVSRRWVSHFSDFLGKPCKNITSLTLLKAVAEKRPSLASYLLYNHPATEKHSVWFDRVLGT